MTGYRGFSYEFVKTFPVLSQGFEIETEMTIHALDKNFSIKSIPIQYRDRPEGSESKLNTVSDGMKVIKTIIKMFKDFKPRQFFWIFSLLFVLLGLIVGIPVVIEFIRTGYITKMPSAILATGIMILAIIIAQCGVILDTVVKQHREKYELELLRYTQIENLKKM